MKSREILQKDSNSNNINNNNNNNNTNNEIKNSKLVAISSMLSSALNLFLFTPFIVINIRQ